MELELKHISPYLIYGLKGRVFGNIDIVTGVCFEHGIIETLNNNNALLRSFKPILRPLSDLKDFIAELNSELGTLDGRYKMIKNMLCFVQDNKQVLVSGNVDTMPYNVVCILLREHFDIFNLIPQGLAIDKNTLDI